MSTRQISSRYSTRIIPAIRLPLFILVFATGLIVAAETGPGQPSGESKEIIPPVSEFTFNQRWVNPALCGKRFWYSINAAGPVYDQIMDIERCAWTADSEEQLILAGKINPDVSSLYPPLRPRYVLVGAGKVPVTHICMRSRPFWDEQKRAVLWGKMPTKEEIRTINQKLGSNFLGWNVNSEWGNGFHQMLKFSETGDPSGFCPVTREYIVPIIKGTIRGPVTTRKEFAQTAAAHWRAHAEPFDYQVEASDGSYYWAIQWPAILGARSIMTENRYWARSTTLFQAFTRAAGRMGNIPWGYAPGCEGGAVVPPYRSTVPSDLDQHNRGWFTTFPPNLLRRMMYYMCMGNAAIIRDELSHRIFSGTEEDGPWRLNWYGHLWEEVMDFSDRHSDRGTPYTPIGVCLAWDNGFSGIGDPGPKAFNKFEYDDGEHMTRELFNRVLYPTGESGPEAMDLFGASPYGDIYDPLRIDTPRGPLPMELLKNYKVLFAVGRQNLDQALAGRFKEYVTQGGTLILNVKQLGEGLLGNDFLGVGLGETERKETRMVCRLDGKELRSGTFTYTPLKLQGKATALYGAPNGDVLAARHPFGKGLVITIGVHWMLEDEKAHPRPGETQAHMLPMANDLVGRLVKAVLPFEVRGKQVPERVLYQVNRKGKGWVISLYNNSGRETYGGNGPEKVWADHRVDVEITVAPEITRAVEWISRDRLRIDRDNMYQPGGMRIGLDPGEVRIVEFQPEEIPPVQVVERVNLALNRPAKASSFCKDHGPELAVNGNRDIYDAWWSKEHCDSKTPQWLEVDLGEVKKINSINTVFMWSEDNQILQRIYQYHVEASVDGQTWNKLFDESKNLSPAHPRGHHRYFNPVEARQVRITTTLNTAVSGAQLVEFEVYGDEKASRTYHWNKTPPMRTKP